MPWSATIRWQELIWPKLFETDVAENEANFTHDSYSLFEERHRFTRLASLSEDIFKNSVWTQCLRRIEAWVRYGHVIIEQS